MPRDRTEAPKTVTIALQGGAAHGAFAWGVLDRLLEDERIAIEGVAGTSSGAINAALLAYGLIGNDRAAARALLGHFWRRISEECATRRWSARLLFRLLRSRLRELSRKEAFFDVMTRILLPYDFDPATMDPLRKVVAEVIDFERLRAADTIQLFVNATNIATNTNRIFTRAEISVDAVCASCCLPYLFDAVEIDGEHYWDGGYMGNPTIYPLIYDCRASDVIMVLTAPIGRKALPATSTAILSRINQVSFASAFMREMRAMAFVTRLIDEGLVSPKAGLRKIRTHAIAPPADDPGYRAEERFNGEWWFFERLRDHGRRIADAWLASSFDKLGRESSLDIEASFT